MGVPKFSMFLGNLEDEKSTPLENANMPANHQKECQAHGVSETPRLDAYLQGPNFKAHLKILNASLADATEEGVCLKCTMEAISQTMASCLHDFRKAKKNESRQEKKAMKAEAKGLTKDLKRNFNHTWRYGSRARLGLLGVNSIERNESV